MKLFIKLLKISIYLILIHNLLNRNFLTAQDVFEDQNSADNLAISTAIGDFIKVFFVEPGIPFDLKVFGNRTKKVTMIVDGILKQNAEFSYSTTIFWYPIVKR